jgi:hypothetical protein
VNPIELVARFIALERELFQQAGATINTPDTREDDAGATEAVAPTVHARTVIQADADVLVLVHPDRVHDVELINAHLEQVGAWFARLEATMTAMVAWLRAAGTVLSVVLFGLLLVVSWDLSSWWHELARVLGAVLISLAVPKLLGWTARAALRRVLRRGPV